MVYKIKFVKSSLVFLVLFKAICGSLYAGPDLDLQLAADYDNLEKLRAAIAAGGDVFHRERGGNNVIWKAAGRGSLKTLEILLEKVTNPTTEQLAMLSYALLKVGESGEICRQDSALRIAELLLQKGANVNHSADGKTPLTQATRSGCEELMKVYFAKGAKIDQMSAFGLTPLHYACQDASLSTIKLLLAKGAKLNGRDAKGNSPLHTAAAAGRLEIIKFLLSQKVDINAVNRENETALLLAAKDAYSNTVVLLLQNKANVNVKSKGGWTALHAAESRKSQEMIAMLRSAGAKDEPKPANFSEVLAWHENRFKAKPVVVETNSNTREENYKKHKTKLDAMAAQMVRLAAQIDSIESEMAAIGWTGPSYAARTVTGYQCDANNQNCKATYQGGGETGSSYWRRRDNESKQRDLERKRNIAILEYDSLAYKYNEFLEGKRR